MKLKGRRQSTNVEWDINFGEPRKHNVRFLDKEAGDRAIMDAKKKEINTRGITNYKDLNKNQKENITKTYLNKIHNAGRTPTPTPKPTQVTPGKWKTINK